MDSIMDLVGDKIQAPTLTEFMLLWLSLFSHSVKAKVLWKEQTGIAIRSCSPTRWWSRWECMKQLLDLFGDVETFLRKPDEFSSATQSKLLSLFSDQSKKSLLQIELALVVDFGEKFVKATYNLEGDNLLAFRCYEVVSALTVAVDLPHYPNLSAISLQISHGNSTAMQQLIDYGKACVQPAIQYYKQKLNDCMKGPLQAFKAARIFVPTKVQEMQVTLSDVDEFAVFPFIDNTVLQQLKSELPQYVAACGGKAPSYSLQKFWQNHSTTLPCWCATAAKVALLQPSSAGATSVFYSQEFLF